MLVVASHRTWRCHERIMTLTGYRNKLVNIGIEGLTHVVQYLREI